MCAHRLRRDRELERDLLAGGSRGDQPQDLALADGQLIEVGVDLGLRDLAGKGVEDGPARRGENTARRREPGARPGEFRPRDRLRHVAAGAARSPRSRPRPRRTRRAPRSAAPDSREPRGDHLDAATPGMWTSSRTTSGCSAAIRWTASSTEPASPRTSSLPSSRPARRCERSRGRRRSRPPARRRPPACSIVAHAGSILDGQLDLGSRPRRRADHRAAAVALHPADDRLAEAAAVGGTEAGSKPAPRSRTKTCARPAPSRRRPRSCRRRRTSRRW